MGFHRTSQAQKKTSLTRTTQHTPVNIREPVSRLGLTSRNQVALLGNYNNKISYISLLFIDQFQKCQTVFKREFINTQCSPYMCSINSTCKLWFQRYSLNSNFNGFRFFSRNQIFVEMQYLTTHRVDRFIGYMNLSVLETFFI